MLQSSYSWNRWETMARELNAMFRVIFHNLSDLQMQFGFNQSDEIYPTCVSRGFITHETIYSVMHIQGKKVYCLCLHMVLPFVMLPY